jgi:hypothetical protein
MGDFRAGPTILLAPSYGNRHSQRHYHDTILGTVDFESSEHRRLLSEGQLERLRSLHPAGKAHFWGAIAKHNKAMDKMRTGDVVVFTGGKRVKAAGEIGFLFRNQAFADLLWKKSSAEDSFVNVYSVFNVQQIERPISDLWQLNGFTHGDYIAGQRPVRHEQVPDVLREFRISTSFAEAMLDAEVRAVGQALENGSRVVPVEVAHTDTVWQQVAARTVEYERVESLLVRHYQAFCGDDRLSSFVTGNGRRADLYREDGDEVEIIEAKSLASHVKVREAVAQLLDYSAHSLRPVTRLSALFPLRPAQDSIEYLHRLGIDCIFRTNTGAFERVDANDERRHYLRRVWRGEP